MIYLLAKVICNDYDNYMKRLQNIKNTQELYRKIIDAIVEERNRKISDDTKAQIDEIILNNEGFVNLITLSRNLLYSLYTLTDIKEFLGHELIIFW